MFSLFTALLLCCCVSFCSLLDGVCLSGNKRISYLLTYLQDITGTMSDFDASHRVSCMPMCCRLTAHWCKQFHVLIVIVVRGIIGGSPTPRVTWERINGTSLSVRHRLESFGQQLTIDSVEYNDAGTYECQGINDMAMVPLRRSIALSVECKYSLSNITAVSTAFYF